jgi:hypothetical protein
MMSIADMLALSHVRGQVQSLFRAWLRLFWDGRFASRS